MHAPRFDTKTGEWTEPGEGLCSLFDLGGKISGSSNSTASQSAAVSFLPTVNDIGSSPFVSSYPAGQGLSSINTALPASAAYLAPGQSYGTSTNSSASTWLIVAALAAAAYFFVKR